MGWDGDGEGVGMRTVIATALGVEMGKATVMMGKVVPMGMEVVMLVGMNVAGVAKTFTTARPCSWISFYHERFHTTGF